MSLQIKVFTAKTIATVIGLSLVPFAVTAPLLAQDAPADGIADETVADLMREYDCAILTVDGRIIEVDGADADIDDDGRVERFCTPARIDWLDKNENFIETEILTRTDYDDDEDYDEDETLLVDSDSIRSIRQVEPEGYAIVISRVGVVTGANVVDIINVSEEEAMALLTEIERSRTVVIERQEITPAPAPVPVPTPAPTPVPAPVPQVQPAPAPSVPALW
jgi:hypothetical protein